MSAHVDARDAILTTLAQTAHMADPYVTVESVIDRIRAMTPQQQRQLLDLDHVDIEHIAALVGGEVHYSSVSMTTLAWIETRAEPAPR